MQAINNVTGISEELGTIRDADVLNASTDGVFILFPLGNTATLKMTLKEAGMLQDALSLALDGDFLKRM